MKNGFYIRFKNETQRKAPFGLCGCVVLSKLDFEIATKMIKEKIGL